MLILSFGRNGYFLYFIDKLVFGLNVMIKDEDVGIFSCWWKLGWLMDRLVD